MAEDTEAGTLIPVGPAEIERFARLIAERLGPPGRLGSAWAKAHARAALRAGRGLTDGRAVACLDPPGARTPIAWQAWLVSLGLPAVLLVGAGATLPEASLVLGLVGLVALGALVLTAFAPGARWRRAARRRGDAWLYAVAKPAGDPPRSAGPFLAALAAHLDSGSWPCSLVTDAPALVARYREIGFELEGQVKTAILLQRAHPCAPGAPMGARFARE